MKKGGLSPPFSVKLLFTTFTSTSHDHMFLNDCYINKYINILFLNDEKQKIGLQFKKLDSKYIEINKKCS